jgi:hypothetical protein
MKWIVLLIRFYPLLGDLYEHVLTVAAILNTERKEWVEFDEDKRAAAKKKDAVDFLRKLPLFTSKSTKQLEKIIQSSYNFVYHKEK